MLLTDSYGVNWRLVLDIADFINLIIKELIGFSSIPVDNPWHQDNCLHDYGFNSAVKDLGLVAILQFNIMKAQGD